MIITSRNPGWGAVAQKLPIEKWPPAVALEFLIKRTTLNDRATLAEIALELDHLPLALEQAGAESPSGGGRKALLAELYVRTHLSRDRLRGLTAPAHELERLKELVDGALSDPRI